MRKGFLGGVGLAVIIVAGLICVAKCTVRVPAGYVAVEYKMNGGISNDTLPQGWHLISPTVKTSLYSIGIEQSYLTSEDKGDSPKDESFKTPTADGKQLLVDLEFSYKFDQDQVADVFTRFKGQSGESVKNTFIKPKMKAWTQEVTAKYPVTDVFGDKRQELNEALDKYPVNFAICSFSSSDLYKCVKYCFSTSKIIESELYTVYNSRLMSVMIPTVPSRRS